MNTPKIILLDHTKKHLVQLGNTFDTDGARLSEGLLLWKEYNGIGNNTTTMMLINFRGEYWVAMYCIDTEGKGSRDFAKAEYYCTHIRSVLDMSSIYPDQTELLLSLMEEKPELKTFEVVKGDE